MSAKKPKPQPKNYASLVTALLVIFFLNLIFTKISGVKHSVELQSNSDLQAGPKPEDKKYQPSEESFVSRVVDGDTIVTDKGETIRYIGMDTPETVDPRKPVQCFGKEASKKNKELVAGKRIRTEKDVSEKDRYGRLLRYVWVGDIFVNDYLVRQGYARVATFPPDIKYQQQFLEAEREAKENNRGLWSACK